MDHEIGMFACVPILGPQGTQGGDGLNRSGVVDVKIDGASAKVVVKGNALAD